MSCADTDYAMGPGTGLVPPTHTSESEDIASLTSSRELCRSPATPPDLPPPMLDPSNGGSRFYEDCTPDDTTRSPEPLSRHGTVTQNSAQLKSILGNANSRVNSGFVLLSTSEDESSPELRMALEKAKPRSRVELDIILESDTCVQGGYLRGHIHLHIRKREENEHSIMVSGGKLRVLGFECILQENERFIFYQCSDSFSSTGAHLDAVYDSSPDDEGFSSAKEGIYVLPFALHLPLSANNGVPKGILHAQVGVAVQYIVMVSLRVKDSVSGAKSISHFYRDCSVWPRLNPTIVLAPTPRPIQVTASAGLFLGGTGKVNLTAALHRLHWIAGQQCCVKINVVNGTKKCLKHLTLSIHRSITMYKARPQHDSQTSNFVKQVAESTLMMCDRSTSGHASAKGWWVGVPAGESSSFSHSILIPPDSLSIIKGKLLEVEYTLRVSLSSGAFLATDVQVTLPFCIINFLSIDPPLTSSSPTPLEQQYEGFSETDDEMSNLNYPDSISSGISSRLESDRGVENVHENHTTRQEFETTFDEHYSVDPVLSQKPDSEKLGNLALQDDTDEVVRHAVTSATTDAECDHLKDTPRFADLYYASLQESLDQISTPPVKERSDSVLSHSSSRTRPSRPRGPSNFALRVEEKKRQGQSFQGEELFREESGLLLREEDQPTLPLKRTPIVEGELSDSASRISYSSVPSERSILQSCKVRLSRSIEAIPPSKVDTTPPVTLSTRRPRLLPTPPDSSLFAIPPVSCAANKEYSSRPLVHRLETGTHLSNTQPMEEDPRPTPSKEAKQSVKDKIRELEARSRATEGS